MSRLLLAALSAWLVLCGPPDGRARDGVSEPLLVGAVEAPPFVLRRADGSLDGLAVELWAAVAEAAGLRYELRPTALRDVFGALAAGDLDVAIGALSMTTDREVRVDFLHPFYETGLGIGVPTETGAQLHAVLAALAALPVLATAAVLLLLLAASGLIIWLAERRHNPQFQPAPHAGITAGIWWAAVTLTTVGYGDKTPRSLIGRVFATVFMLVGVVLFASLTGHISATLTHARLQADIAGPEDLENRRVGAPDGSTAAASLERRGVVVIGFDEDTAGLEALADQRIDAYVTNRPILLYLERTLEPGKVHTLQGVFEPEMLAFAVGSASALREPLNRALLTFLAGREWPPLQRRFLGPLP